MREAYVDELDAVQSLLVDMIRMVGAGVSQATTALLDANVSVADQTIGADSQINAMHAQVEERCLEILAMQAPVAGDLRMIFSAITMATTVERMGDLAVSIAEIARRRYPGSAVPLALREDFLVMGNTARLMCEKVGNIIASRDLDRADELERDEDQMNALHRKLFAELMADDFGGTVEEAIDATLISRFYERLADHCVSLARRTRFVVTGEHEPGRATSDT
jgi:phosphate transport system protein